jgi:hypothetical protein
MLAKSGLLSQRQRLPTVCLAFILLPRGYRAQGGLLQLRAAGGPTQQLWFREVCLWQVEPERWWEDVPGLMTLYPLCRHGRTPRDAIGHAAETIKQTVTGQTERDDQLLLLSIFGGLAYPRLDVEHIIGRDVVLRVSKIVRRILREGQVEARQADLLKVIRRHYGADAATEWTAAVQAITDPELLERLFDRALEGVPLNDLRTELPSP